MESKRKIKKISEEKNIKWREPKVPKFVPFKKTNWQTSED